MAGSALVRAFFGDGDYEFRLDIPALEELQDLTTYGPHALLARFQLGQWGVRELRETLRLGLVGGGRAKINAYDLVQRHVAAGGLAELVPTCGAILGAALFGVPEEDADLAGEASGEGAAISPTPSPTAGSAGADITN